MKKILWIGLVNITPKENNNELSGAKGAFTNVLMYASSKDNFIKVVKDELFSRGYNVVEFDDVETFRERSNKYQLRDELVKLAKIVENTGNIGIDRLHLYESEECQS